MPPIHSRKSCRRLSQWTNLSQENAGTPMKNPPHTKTNSKAMAGAGRGLVRNNIYPIALLLTSRVSGTNAVPLRRPQKSCCMQQKNLFVTYNIGTSSQTVMQSSLIYITNIPNPNSQEAFVRSFGSSFCKKRTSHHTVTVQFRTRIIVNVSRICCGNRWFPMLFSTSSSSQLL